jgi:hypothetical protein
MQQRLPRPMRITTRHAVPFTGGNNTPLTKNPQRRVFLLLNNCNYAVISEQITMRIAI